MRRETQEQQDQRDMDAIARVIADMAEGRDFWSAFYSQTGKTFPSDIEQFKQRAIRRGESSFVRLMEAGSEPRQPQLWIGGNDDDTEDDE